MEENRLLIKGCQYCYASFLSWYCLRNSSLLLLDNKTHAILHQHYRQCRYASRRGSIVHITTSLTSLLSCSVFILGSSCVSLPFSRHQRSLSPSSAAAAALTLSPTQVYGAGMCYRLIQQFRDVYNNKEEEEYDSALIIKYPTHYISYIKPYLL